jgi:hypothetical protein
MSIRMERVRIIAENGLFRLVETAADGPATVIGQFRTEAAARDGLMKHLTMLNAASLARWVAGQPEASRSSGCDS